MKILYPTGSSKSFTLKSSILWFLSFQMLVQLILNSCICLPKLRYTKATERRQINVFSPGPLWSVSTSQKVLWLTEVIVTHFSVNIMVGWLNWDEYNGVSYMGYILVLGWWRIFSPPWVSFHGLIIDRLSKSWNCFSVISSIPYIMNSINWALLA
jgi:hypothetical protein